MTGAPTTRPRMVVFAGPNGSGKSTLTRALMLREKIPGTYINADDIARIEFGHIPDELQRNMAAAKLAEQRRMDALESGQSFTFETVMSTPGKLAILQEARARGFQVELMFVTTFDAAINIGRVANRAALGGHAVEPAAVRERYGRTMRLLPSAVDLADRADVFDNSSPRMLRVAMKRGKALTPLNTDKAPAWVQERLVAPCRERAASRLRMEAACKQRAAGHAGVLRDADIRHGQTYCGEVVDADEQYVLQCTGANTCLLHDRALCPPVVFSKGANAAFPYFYEKGGKHRVAAAPDSSCGNVPGRLAPSAS